jgi:hypothetical protein
MKPKKLSFAFFLSMFDTARLNPNHRGGGGTAPKIRSPASLHRKARKVAARKRRYEALSLAKNTSGSPAGRQKQAGANDPYPAFNTAHRQRS